MVTALYCRYGKYYRKIPRDEIIQEGAFHSLANGEMYPIMGIDTIGDIPSSFSKQRDFYHPVSDKERLVIVGDCPLCRNRDDVHCERTDSEKVTTCIECGSVLPIKEEKSE